MLSSVVGFYSSPLFTRLLPERQDTPLTKVRPPPPLHRAVLWGRAMGQHLFSSPDHRELRLIAGAQLRPARLLQDAG